jgi:hypothetical protein
MLITMMQVRPSFQRAELLQRAEKVVGSFTFRTNPGVFALNSPAHVAVTIIFFVIVNKLFCSVL